MTTKSDIAKRLVNRYPDLYQKDVNDIVNIVFSSISEALVKGWRVELRGFGAFSIRKRSPREARNPKTNKKVNLNERFAIYFRAGKKIRERIDAA